MFVNESLFCLQHHDDRIRNWQHRGKRMLREGIRFNHAGSAARVIIWGAIEYTSWFILVRIGCILNSDH